MPIDKANIVKIRNFLRTNLEVLKGEDLAAFVEKYEVREAGPIEMMILDMGFADGFIAVPHPSKEKTHHVISMEMAEKILYLDELVKENP
jgi:hypothetical protein